MLTVEQPGFRTYRQSGITLRLADRTELDVKLEIGQPSQSIEVTAAAPLLQTASGEVSLNIDEKKITTLPLDGRNFIPLVTLSPGVALPSGQFLPRINGSRPRTNEYIYDGISVLQPEPGQVVYYPIIDGMAEFKLNINAYSPEYGRSNGGTVMVIGKSGSNEFHGSLFEFFRNEELNARNLFAQPGPKPEFRRNQYGVTVGGPIQKNKTFFFADWQGTRLRTGITRFSVVPTLAQRQGIFTQAIFDPATSPRTQFPNNTIPASRFDPIAPQVLQHYPLPNVAGRQQFRRAPRPNPTIRIRSTSASTATSARSIASSAATRIFRDDDTPVTPLPDGSGSLTSGVIGHAITRGDAFAGDYDWTLSPSTLNQVRFGYSRRDLNQTLAAEWRHHRARAAGEFLLVGAADLHGRRVPADRTDHRGQLQLHHLHHGVSRYLLDGARPAHHQVRHRHPARSAGRSESAESDRIVRLHHHGHQQHRGRGQRQRAGVAAARAGERVHHRYPEAT